MCGIWRLDLLLEPSEPINSFSKSVKFAAVDLLLRNLLLCRRSGSMNAAEMGMRLWDFVSTLYIVFTLNVPKSLNCSSTSAASRLKTTWCTDLPSSFSGWMTSAGTGLMTKSCPILPSWLCKDTRNNIIRNALFACLHSSGCALQGMQVIFSHTPFKWWRRMVDRGIWWH